MSISKSVQAASLCVNEMVNVQPGEDVLVVADESGMDENGEIIDAIIGLARQKGADANLVVMDDLPAVKGNYLPPAVQRAMPGADVIVGCTYTTWASAYYHPTPHELVNDDEVRILGLVKRSWEALTGPHILESDFEENLRRAERLTEIFDEGTELRVTSEKGTDLTASIDGKHGSHEIFAHEPGEIGVLAGIGEADVGPVVGSTEGTAVIDGPLGLPESPWPSPPLELTIGEGVIRSVEGDEAVAADLAEIFEENENAANIAEFGVGVNPRSKLKEFQVWKKQLGTAHIGIGDGLDYEQDVASPVHIDCVMNRPKLAVDGDVILADGELRL